VYSRYERRLLDTAAGGREVMIRLCRQRAPTFATSTEDLLDDR
jgi:hypothetical protein